MTIKLFFSQHVLDSLVDEGKIKGEKKLLSLLNGERPSFEPEPAYRIVRSADDPNHLVGLIRSERDIPAMVAEECLNSVIFRDVAYEAEPGFIDGRQELMDELFETDLLTRFLLENLF